MVGRQGEVVWMGQMREKELDNEILYAKHQALFRSKGKPVTRYMTPSVGGPGLWYVEYREVREA